MAWVENYGIPYLKETVFNIHCSADHQTDPKAFVTEKEKNRIILQESTLKNPKPLFSESACDLGLIKSWVKDVCKDPNGIVALLGDVTDDDRPTTRGKRKQTFAERAEVMDNDAFRMCTWIDQALIPILAPLATMRLPMLGILAGHHWWPAGA